MKLFKITAHSLRNREGLRLQLFEVPEQGHEATVSPQVVSLDVMLSNTTLNSMIAKINLNNPIYSFHVQLRTYLIFSFVIAK